MLFRSRIQVPTISRQPGKKAAQGSLNVAEWELLSLCEVYSLCWIRSFLNCDERPICLPAYECQRGDLHAASLQFLREL